MSATMLESLDTPMLDCQNDHDTPMHNNSDPWYQGEEHAMEDEAHEGSSHISVEVEMEGFEEEHNPEYEMADTEDHIEAQSHETIDIELFDVSRNPSPYHHTLSLEENTPVNSIAREEHHHAPKVPTPLSLSPEEGNMAARPLPFSTDDEEIFAPQAGSTEDHVEPAIADHAHFPPVPLRKSPSDSENTTLPSEATKIHQEDGLPKESEVVVALVSQEVPGVAPVHDQDTLNTVPESSEVEANSANTVQAAVTDVQEASSASSNSLPESHAEQLPEEDEHEHVSSAASSGDPHEISEGVYIDPPPPVLMSFGSEVLLVTLFNAALTSPSTSAALDPPVLLSHQPTLYYEPLSSVFEALRQEEHLYGIPNLLDGELILDAYDLDLVMSEDYTFAHELTLHDLNVLHDGLHKPGPLRVQLRNAGPRFNDRYHILQQQVQQLEISAIQANQASETAEHRQDTEDVPESNEDDHEKNPNLGEISHHPIPVTSDGANSEADMTLKTTLDQLPPLPEDDYEDYDEYEEGATKVSLAVTETEEGEAEEAPVDGSEHDPAHQLVETGLPDDLQNTLVQLAQEIEDDDSPQPNIELGVKSNGQAVDFTLAEPSTELNKSGPDVSPQRSEEQPVLTSENIDEFNLEFEEIDDDDEHSVTASNADTEEREFRVSADGPETPSYDEDDWGKTLEERQESDSYEDSLESVDKLHRSFGSSKRSISEAELEDLEGEEYLSTSPGSKRPRVE